MTETISLRVFQTKLNAILDHVIASGLTEVSTKPDRDYYWLVMRPECFKMDVDKKDIEILCGELSFDMQQIKKLADVETEDDVPLALTLCYFPHLLYLIMEAEEEHSHAVFNSLINELK